MRALFVLFLLSACTQANHLGNPLTLPVRGLTTAVENSAYAARRARVKDVLGRIGPTGLPAQQAQLWAVAPVPLSNQNKVLQEIAALERTEAWAENATVIVMVHLP